MLGDFIINRSVFFSTEPKYIASVLLVTFSCLLISQKKSSGRNLFILFYLVGFLFILAASAFFILFFSVIILYFRFIGPKIYSAVVFLSPIFLLPALIDFFINLAGQQETYLFLRLISASSDVGTGEIFNLTLFGESFGASCDGQICEDAGLLGNLLSTYGVIGFLLFWFFFYKFTYSMFAVLGDKRVNSSFKIGMMILLNTYVIFNIYFFSDILNMFGVFIILIIILLPHYFYENILTSFNKDNQLQEKVFDE